MQVVAEHMLQPEAGAERMYLHLNKSQNLLTVKNCPACEMAHASSQIQAVKPSFQMANLRIDEPDVNCINFLSGRCLLSEDRVSIA